MSRIAKDINHGQCMFCGNVLYACDEDGDVCCPTNDWVTCEDITCTKGAIATTQYEHPDQCASRADCPHYEGWHDDECDDCDRGDCDDCNKKDCDDCDRQDCDDCDRMSDSAVEEMTDNIIADLEKAMKSYREENGSFQENTVEDMRVAIQKVIDGIKDGDY
jgi:hypothetical protein